MKKFIFILASLISMSSLAGIEPFENIGKAKSLLQDELNDAILLSIRMTDEETKYIFTHHIQRKTIFVTLKNSQESTVEVVNRYPWIGVLPIEEAMPNMKFSYANAIEKMEDMLGDNMESLAKIELYRPNHFMYASNIYARFVFTDGNMEKSLLFNFMNGEVTEF